MHENEISKAIIGAAIRVHSALGPGLLESAYEACLMHELIKNGLEVQRQIAMPISYDGIQIDVGYRVDLLIERKVIVELKAVQEMNSLFTAQVLSYLKLSGTKLGLIINFNVKRLLDGVKRVGNGLEPDATINSFLSAFSAISAVTSPSIP